LVAITAAYYPTFRGDFILDDLPFVRDNPAVQGFKPLITYFLQEDGIVEAEAGRAHSGYYRPLAGITYSMDSFLWGSDGSGFRTTNLILHLFTCLLLYCCMRRVLKERAGPLVATLLFGLHPVNTEAVAWVASRNNILVSLFSLASFYFYVRRKEQPKIVYGMLSLTSFALALLSKEFAVMLLPIIFVYDLVVDRSGKPFRDGVWGYSAFFFILCGYLVLRISAIHDLAPFRYTVEDLKTAFCFAPYLLMENAELVFFPADLHNMIVRYPETCFGKEGVVGFAGLVLISLFVWKWRDERILSFSFLSFGLALFPVLNIVPTSAYSVVSMRWIYFPMCFLCFFAARILGRAAANKRRFVSFAAMAAVAVYMGLYTFVLNEHLWKTEEDFFRSEVEVFNNHFYAGDLGRIHHSRGEYEEAERFYKIAGNHPSPDGVSLWLNYAALLAETNRAEAALDALARAESLNPGMASRGKFWNIQGSVFYKTGDYPSAVRAFEKAAAFAPEERSYRMNLRLAYMRSGETEKAFAISDAHVREGKAQ
jgi:hypothetical protein